MSAGPDDITGAPGMRVPPHPHTGLQTVSWLVSGEVLHRDSVGSHQLITAGQLNLMTAGHGISHSEESPADHSPTLHGVQLWTALPDRDRHADPHFEHHAALPVLTDSGVTVTVIMGEIGVAASPAPGSCSSGVSRSRKHIIMWWNFVGRDHEDIVTARDEWMSAGRRFGTVRG